MPLAAVGVTAAGLIGASPAAALNYVPATNGDSWAVSDAAIPGLDTGSIHNTATGSLQGYGGLRVHVEGAPGLRLNDALMRGFGLKFDGQNRFSTTHAVGLGGVSVSRSILIDKQNNWGRWLDTFTNTTKQPIKIQVAFGGQTGYNTVTTGATGGDQQSAVAATSSGDTAITPADTWTEFSSQSGNPANPSTNGPQATITGSAAPFAGAMTRVGSFLRDPFTVDLPTTGDEANHAGYVHALTLAPGQTKSLAEFVVIGLSEKRAITTGAAIPAAGTQVSAVATAAGQLAAAPPLSDLSTAQICSLANWDLSTITITGFSAADCATAKPIENDAKYLAAPAPTTSSPYDVTGKTITELEADMASGKTTSQEITRAYLDRIAAYDIGPEGFHAIISVNQDAMEEAKQADIDRANGVKLPLLGIPIAVKDLYDVKGLPTTGGSQLFDGYEPNQDQYQVAKLKQSGAIILAKANLAEFATDGHFSPSAFGQVWNAFDPSKSSIGSSGGSAVSVATSMAAAALGTQTGDSLWGPSSAASLVSLRGTDGMESADGVMPLTYIQDYAGVIARSLPDLATLLNSVTGTNPNDPLSVARNADAHRPADWTASLDAHALEDKVIGYAPTAFADPFGTTGTSNAMFSEIQTNFTAAGATVKQIPDPPSAPAATTGDKNYQGWLAWVQAHPNSPLSDPAAIITSQLRNPLIRPASSTYTGLGPMTDAQIQGFIQYRQTYRNMLKQWMDDNGVDAVVYPGQLSDIHLNDSIQPSFGRRDPQGSAAGVPNVIFPAGKNDHGQPINLQLQGREWDDAKLLGYAYAFEAKAGGHVETTQAPSLTYEAGATPKPIEITAAPTPVTTPPANVPAPTTEASTTAVPTAPASAGAALPATSTKPLPTGKVLATTLKASTAGKVAVKVSCTSTTTSCKVQVVLTRSGKTVAKKTVTVKPGKTATATLTLSSSVRKSVNRGSKVTAYVSLKGSAGTTSTVKSKVTITRKQ
ncbi:MAG: amidase family protein [Solirubrobacteraceae bacterium]|nr:amidase family protein [Patulibacter sp.]